MILEIYILLQYLLKYTGFGNDYNNDHIDRQYNWLINDLEKFKNSKWKIMFGHRPVYCTKVLSAGPGEGIDTGQ